MSASPTGRLGGRSGLAAASSVVSLQRVSTARSHSQGLTHSDECQVERAMKTSLRGAQRLSWQIPPVGRHPMQSRVHLWVSPHHADRAPRGYQWPQCCRMLSDGRLRMDTQDFDTPALDASFQMGHRDFHTQ